MKLTTTTFVSVDGVMQGVGTPDEDRSGGFDRATEVMQAGQQVDPAARAAHVAGHASTFRPAPQ